MAVPLVTVIWQNAIYVLQGSKSRFAFVEKSRNAIVLNNIINMIFCKENPYVFLLD